MAKAQYDLNWSSREDRDVREILRAFEQARRKKAEAEMVATARQLGERRFFQSPDGFGGYISMNVNAESFHYWGQRLGYDCWNDPQFCREYLRDNDYARVKNAARTRSVTVTGDFSNKRFSKKYEGGSATGNSAKAEQQLRPTTKPEEVACAA